MNQQTKAIISATLAADPAMTKEKQNAIMAAINAAITGAPATAGHVLKWKDAAARLGVSVVAARQYAHRGLLTPVSPKGGRAYGVTAESLAAFINNATKGAAYLA